MTDGAGNYEIGMVGLGVIGQNLTLNIADHGYSVVGLDRDPQKIAALNAESEKRSVRAVGQGDSFAGLLRKPRAIFILVPAGPPVDAVIKELLPSLDPGDILIDAGNSYYKDTELRQKSVAEKGIQLLGVGLSGGETGARYGPSLMPGGPLEAYERVRPIFEAVAAKVNGDPCVAYLGPGSAGHYVKMVHNGLEYGWMELIAECYDLLERGLGLSDQQIESVFEDWERSELSSYLIEITANIFGKIDQRTGKLLVDVILDEARQKGTGKWVAQDAMDLQVPVPTIDIAVSSRDLSRYKDDRERACRDLSGPDRKVRNPAGQVIDQAKNALYAGMIITFAQGMALLGAASAAYGYHLDLEAVARIWRGGCIIRAALLEKIRSAYQKNPVLSNLLLDPALGEEVVSRQEDLRGLVATAAQTGLPFAGMMASLAYYDGLRSDWLPANLIQAQRDYFGAHTYERVDDKGVFHTHWEE